MINSNLSRIISILNLRVFEVKRCECIRNIDIKALIVEKKV